MALSGLHTNWDNGSYGSDRNIYLQRIENIWLYNGNLTYLQPYYDGSIAIGYGFDLLVHTANQITSYLNQANDALNLQGDQRIVLSQDDIDLLNEARSATPTGREEISSDLDLVLPSTAYADALLTIKLNEYETALDAALGGHSQLADSKERIAVISLLYTMTMPTATAIMATIPSTLNAIKHDNRAEAWYQIRYVSNSDGQHASRRYSEANLFGLYDSGAMTDEEAKEVLRMYTIHKIEIGAYESRYAPPATISTEIELAKIYLGANLNINGEIIVGAGLPTYAYMEGDGDDAVLLGTAQNDLIFGEAGDDGIIGMDGEDVIYGGSGNDTIIGGADNDILEGGAGNDDYIFQSGDGSDKINDSQGTNRILWEDSNGNLHVEKTFYKTAEAEWKSADGTTEVNQNSPYKMVFPDGTTVELGESISSFDINLKDVPENPVLLIV